MPRRAAVSVAASLSLTFALLAACALLLSSPAAGSAGSPGSRITTTAQDADGDGVPNASDPDDDNDGVLDNQEGAPGQQPTPAGHGGAPDADGDGIADDFDPDDDNNGVTDNDEPSEPSSPNAPPSGGTGSGGTGSDSAQGSGENQILSLPVTGTGLRPAGQPWILLLALLLFGATASIAIAASRCPEQQGTVPVAKP